MEKIMELVSDMYQNEIPMKQIAKRLQISEQKVRKILITTGQYQSARSKEIADMVQAGKTVSEIAEKTGLSTTCVSANLPYDKGLYGITYASKNALAIRKSRERKKAL